MTGKSLVSGDMLVAIENLKKVSAAWDAMDAEGGEATGFRGNAT